MSLNRRFISCLLALTMAAGLLAGCAAPAAPAAEPCRYELAAMDTFMTLTVYGLPDEEAQAVLQQAAARIHQLEELLSVTSEDSEIYKANHAGGEAVSLSADTRELLSEALALCRDTDGALDVTIYPVVRAWGFTTGDYRGWRRGTIPRRAWTGTGWPSRRGWSWTWEPWPRAGPGIG